MLCPGKRKLDLTFAWFQSRIFCETLLVAKEIFAGTQASASVPVTQNWQSVSFIKHCSNTNQQLQCAIMQRDVYYMVSKKYTGQAPNKKNHSFHGQFHWVVPVMQTKWISQVKPSGHQQDHGPEQDPHAAIHLKHNFESIKCYPKKSWLFFSMFPTNKKVCNNLCHINGVTSCCRLGEKKHKAHWGNGSKDHHLQLIEDFKS